LRDIVVTMRRAWILIVGIWACSDDGAPANPRPNHPCVDRTTPMAAHMHLDGRGTYGGDSCIESMCHLPGATGPMAKAYRAAGTIYKEDFVTPQAGATVRFFPEAGGAPTVMVTDTAGNFHLLATAPNPLPSSPDVTACPNVIRMIEYISDDYASCATRSCHARTGPGPGPIYLAD
jgi:hypothetical protein